MAENEVKRFLNLLRLYARRGLEDWRNESRNFRNYAIRSLSADIALDETQADVTINATYVAADGSVDRFRFIPMPRIPRRGPNRFFFLPIREYVNGKVRYSFDLFLLAESGNSLGFRFEPSHGIHTPHGYPHVQICRELLRKTIVIHAAPNWVPVSYPAFPIPSGCPVDIFLAMAVAVHGFRNGLDALLVEIFQEARPPALREAREYVDRLRTLVT